MRKLKHHEIPRLHPNEAARRTKHPISVVVDNVRSVYNVGSMFRTSDAALIEHLYLTGITATPEHRALHKTALGAQDTVAWTYARDVRTVLTKLKDEGYIIAVLEITDSPSQISDLEAGDFPLVLVVGNELHGVSDSAVGLADVALEIPQYGAKQSLNVAVAYGIAVFGLVEHFRRLSH